MIEPQAVSSFVLRCSFVKDEQDGGQWRIRVTYVQGEDEIVVGSVKEAMGYIEGILERG
jgi:hypothetical protein